MGVISHSQTGVKKEKLVLADQDFSADSVTYFFERQEEKEKYYLLMLDEFDMIDPDKKEETQKQFGQLMKSFSNRLKRTKLVIVGVSKNLEELMGAHPSNLRVIDGIKIKKMPDNTLQNILDKRVGLLDISFTDALKKKMITVCEGSPYLMHLLALGIVLDGGEKEIYEEGDFEKGLDFAYGEMGKKS